MDDFERLDQAARELRSAIAAVTPWPLDLFGKLWLAAIFVVGLIVGWTSGYGLLAVPYGLLIGFLALAFCWLVIELAKPRG